MKIRCAECRASFEIDPADQLDAVTCASCGTVFSLVSDTVLDSRSASAQQTIDHQAGQTTVSEADGTLDANPGDTTKHDDAGETERTQQTPDDTVAHDLSIGTETFDYRFEPGGSDRRPSLERIGKFELQEILGSGSFGSVWKARDTDLDREVAIKVPRGWRMERKEVEQFLREARTAAQLKHPNIVGIHDVGAVEDTVYIVSDLITGSTMQEWAIQEARSPKEVVRVCVLVARALHYAHDMGVVHRDLKPANILMNEKGDPFITDFGLAKRDVGDITLTVEGQILGSPAYMSPEQAQGLSHQADRRSDVYSLGVVIYNLLTAELPFRGNFSMLIQQIVDEEPPPPRRLNNHVPRDLETICLKCLQKEPDRRYQSADELAEDLERWEKGEPIQARPVSSLERLWRFCRRKPKIAIPTATSIVLTALTIILLIVGNERIAEKHRESQQHLYEAEVGRVRLARQSFQAGRKTEALDAIRKAVSIRPDGDLRNELVRVLNLAELRVQQEFRPGEDLAEPHFSLFSFFESGVVFVGKGQVPVEFAANGRPVRKFDAIGPLTTPMCISRDGGTLVGVSTARRQLEVWDVRREKRLAVVGKKDVYSKKCCLALTSNALRLTVITHDKVKKKSRVRHFDVSPGKWLAEEISLDGARVECVRYSDDDRWCAVKFAGVDWAVWPVSQPNKVVQLKLGKSARRRSDALKPHLVAFSPNNRWIAVVCENGIVRLWDLEELVLKPGARPMTEIIAHADETRAIGFSDDNQVLITLNADQIRLWDAHSGQLLVEHPVSQPAWQVAIRNDRQFLAGTPEGIARWEYEPGISRNFLVRRPGYGSMSRIVATVRFDPRRKRLAVGGVAEYLPLVNYSQTSSLVHYVPTEESGPLIAFAEDENVVFFGSHAPFRPVLGQVDLKSGKANSQSSKRRIIALTSDEGQLVSAQESISDQGKVEVHVVKNGESLGKITLAEAIRQMGGQQQVYRWSVMPENVRMAQNGSRIAIRKTKEQDRVVTVFDTATGNVLWNSPPLVQTFAVSRLARRVAVATERLLQITDLQSGKSAAIDVANSIRAIALAQEGAVAACVYYDSNIVDVFVVRGESISRLVQLRGPTRDLVSVGMKDSGLMLAASSLSGLVTIVSLEEVNARLKEFGLGWREARAQQ